jgi:hypothetical protein
MHDKVTKQHARGKKAEENAGPIAPVKLLNDAGLPGERARQRAHARPPIDRTLGAHIAAST